MTATAPEYILQDLQGHRCPDVMQKVLKTLTILEASSQEFAVIKTIEPSALRDVNSAIAAKHQGKLCVAESRLSVLTQERRAAILASPQGFDEDDLNGIDNELVILIKKT